MNDKVGGILMGIVVDTNDPAGYKRIRVRIPAIHGSFTDMFTQLLKSMEMSTK